MIETAEPLTYALDRFQTLYPRAIDLSLGRVLNVLDRLGRPQDRLPPVIHVAGTNGKGSTCAFIRAMAEAAGLSVHVYTSPHLVRFNERIRIAGKLIEDGYLIDVLERVWKACAGDPITHFEATTAAALLAFAETPADLLVLEVGLGGRFDATNVVDRPAVSVITPVDYDHKEFLSSDLSRIAWEKAGIIKPRCPVVVSGQSSTAMGVIVGEAYARGAPLIRLGHEAKLSLNGTRYSFEGRRLSALLQPALAGVHQFSNAALAALALEVWGDPRIDSEAVEKGAATVNWPARLQRLSDGPLTRRGPRSAYLLDGGHNPHAARAIVPALQAILAETGGRLQMITAMMANKDHAGYFAPFAALDPDVMTIPNSPGHDGATPEQLCEAAKSVGLSALPMPSLEAALDALDPAIEGPVLICGSLYLAGDVLEKNGQLPD